jgi:3-hydroxyacyl-CoA dehydrogenase
MWHADTVGLNRVRDRIAEFHEQHGQLWEPAPLLQRLAQEGKAFADFQQART